MGYRRAEHGIEMSSLVVDEGLKDHSFVFCEDVLGPGDASVECFFRVRIVYVVDVIESHEYSHDLTEFGHQTVKPLLDPLMDGREEPFPGDCVVDCEFVDCNDLVGGGG
jgi:hypothetical protein